jgi:hypothetical protein
MPSLIVIHGVGLPSEEELARATNSISEAFTSKLLEGSRYCVDWNLTAADRVLDGDRFRWTSVGRMFKALRSATRVGWTTKSSNARLAQVLGNIQSVVLSIVRYCFAAAIFGVLLVPAFGIFAVASDAFNVEAAPIRQWGDFVSPYALWLIPQPLVAHLFGAGFRFGWTLLRVLSYVWLVSLAASAIVALLAALVEQSTSPLRVAARQMFLGSFGPLLILVLLPIYDLRPTIAAVGAIFAGPLLFIVGLFTVVFVITLPFAPSPPLGLAAAEGVAYVAAVATVVLAATYVLREMTGRGWTTILAAAMVAAVPIGLPREMTTSMIMNRFVLAVA